MQRIIFRSGVNSSQIPSDVHTLRDWHKTYFVEKYRRDVAEPDGYVLKDQLVIFPTRRESPICLRSLTPFAYCSRTQKQDIRFDNSLLKTEKNGKSMYIRAKTSVRSKSTVPGLKHRPATNFVTLPGSPALEVQNAQYESECATLDDWFAKFGNGERSKETRKYLGSRTIHNDTSARAWIGTVSPSGRPPNIQIFPHVGNNPQSIRFTADKRLSPFLPPT
jgi:hypothetical protein